MYHISGKKINKYNLLKKIKKIYNKKINIKKENKFCINRSLDSTRFTLQTGYVKKKWDIMILENKRFFLRYAKQKIKLLTILGTRPEIIKLSCIIKNFDKNFEHKLVHTGQNFQNHLTKFFFKDINIRKPDFTLNIKNNDPIIFLSEMLPKMSKIIEKINPDAIFILGDTNSGLASYVAKKKKIPIFHYEAGNRCFDQCVPEELNEKL